MKKKIVAILGAGNMGTAVAQVIASNGHAVRLWNWEGDLLPLKQIERYGENKQYLKGVKLSANIIPTEDLKEAVDKAQIVFFVIPSTVIESVIKKVAPLLSAKTVLVDLTKGLEPKTLKLTTDIITELVNVVLKKNIVAVSGPAIAGQLARKKFTAMNIASESHEAIDDVMRVMENDYLKLIPTNDVIGVELGGAFKNVYAIAMGMCDGLGHGLNTKSALLTYALGEIVLLIKTMGGKEETGYGLAGLGDLIGTALCTESRNRTFGEYLGAGLSGEEAQKKVKQIVEGVSAAACLMKLCEKFKLKMPFAEVIYKCITTKKDCRKIFENFLQKI